MSIDLLYIEVNLTGYGTHGIQRAQAQGLTTALVCRDPREYARLDPDPAELVDRLERVDTYDTSQLMRACLGLEPRAVIAYDDYRLFQAAVVANGLGLPGPDPAGILACRYKDLTRKATAGIGRDVKHVVVPVDGTVTSSPLGYPCVVKPVDDGASAGVRVCRSDENFQAAVGGAIDHSTHGRGYRCLDAVLVEEYVEGPEYSAELLWDNQAGSWRLLGFAETVLSRPPKCKELAHVFPARLDPETEQVAEKTVLKWLESTGHRGTAAHVEFKIDHEGRPALMEINPRLGGGDIRLLIEASTGLDVVDLYQQLWLGRPVALPDRPWDGVAHSVIRYLTPPGDGVVRHIGRPETLDDAVIAHEIQDIGPDGVTATDTSRLGWVVTLHEDAERAVAAADGFHSSLVFE
ncbi:ATP-grasp domain-containing protein [Streptomyces fulvoviolaceus]|uniref:ATP-grasp domain-containing protein n=1 Tax=Streptomyces fulvoviolaceus TaxID=285535 RepID=UPI0004CB7857|nr:ATP-grasp domain-containing protein [Streptomyces fulvoviolaceus]MCT9077925.1 ATP-grasp domain-containing protein [Streptomyces fulvoviolaceus]